MRAAVRAFIDTDHPRLYDGKPATDPRTGQPIPDAMARAEASRILLEIHRAIDRISQLSGYPQEITITADEAAAKLDALEKRVTPPGDGTTDHGNQPS